MVRDEVPWVLRGVPECFWLSQAVCLEVRLRLLLVPDLFLPLVLVAVRVLRVGLVGVPVVGLHGACRLRPWQLIGQSRGGGRTEVRG